MVEDYNIMDKNKERYPRFSNFGEMLFYYYPIYK